MCLAEADVDVAVEESSLSPESSEHAASPITRGIVSAKVALRRSREFFIVDPVLS
jgi:hypothetical protein